MTDTENLAKWFVIHTYSGYENKVKTDIEKIAENRGLRDLILDIKVPTEEVVEIKDNKKKVSQKNVYPGYVIIKMIMTDESWYIIRNARGVTGFVGPGSKPVPLSDEEVEKMGVDKKIVTVDYAVGDRVKVNEGPLSNFVGVVEEINLDRKKIRVVVSMFGRETPVELEFDQVDTIQ